MNEIRLGTIGSGFIVHSILDQVRNTPGIKLAAVYSRNAEKGNQLAGEYGAEKVYTDPDAFFHDPDINTVYIASPNILHYEQAVKALLCGKNVICEKPLCTDAKKARELSELAADRNLFLTEAVPTAFLPNLEILKRELPRIGRVRLVMSNYSQYSSRYDLLKKGEIPNVFNLQYGGGCLMDINYYNVYLNVALFGKPVNAVYYPNMYADLADSSGILVMQYDGFVSECTGAKDTWGVNYFQIEGEDGFIYIDGGSNGLAGIRVVTGSSDETFTLQDNPDRYYYEIRDLTAMFLNHDQEGAYARLRVTLDVMEVLEHARRKAGIIFPDED